MLSALILAGVVVCYLGVGVLRASMLDNFALFQAYREGYRQATGRWPLDEAAEQYLRRVKRAYVVLWAYDDLMRLYRALRG
jgi:hypothetical protein